MTGRHAAPEQPRRDLAIGDPDTVLVCPDHGEPLIAISVELETYRPPVWTESGSVLIGSSYDSPETFELYLQCPHGHEFNCPNVDDWL